MFEQERDVSSLCALGDDLVRVEALIAIRSSPHLARAAQLLASGDYRSMTIGSAKDADLFFASLPRLSDEARWFVTLAERVAVYLKRAESDPTADNVASLAEATTILDYAVPLWEGQASRRGGREGAKRRFGDTSARAAMIREAVEQLVAAGETLREARERVAAETGLAPRSIERHSKTGRGKGRPRKTRKSK